MDIYKEKEVSDTVPSKIDPNDGIKIQNGISADQFPIHNPGTIKAQAFKKHKEHQGDIKSELEDLDIFKIDEDITDPMVIDGVGDFTEEIVSIEELIEYLDTIEKQIDV